MVEPWLKEMEVVQAVRGYLETKGFKIENAVTHLREKGEDIVASSLRQERIKIEAKGQTSSDQRSNRFSKEFTPNQKENHLGRALFKCLTYLNEGSHAGIALPEDEYNKRLIEKIKKPLETLGIVIFFVNGKNNVSTVGKLPA
jgi:hypothetical protein